jgi:hypothetical protein
VRATCKEVATVLAAGTLIAGGCAPSLRMHVAIGAPDDVMWHPADVRGCTASLHFDCDSQDSSPSIWPFNFRTVASHAEMTLWAP